MTSDYPTFSSLFQGPGNNGQPSANQPTGPGGISPPQAVESGQENPWASVQQQGMQQNPYSEQLNTWATMPHQQAPQPSTTGKK